MTRPAQREELPPDVAAGPAAGVGQRPTIPGDTGGGGSGPWDPRAAQRPFRAWGAPLPGPAVCRLSGSWFCCHERRPKDRSVFHCVLVGPPWVQGWRRRVAAVLQAWALSSRITPLAGPVPLSHRCRASGPEPRPELAPGRQRALSRSAANTRPPRPRRDLPGDE